MARRATQNRSLKPKADPWIVKHEKLIESSAKILTGVAALSYYVFGLAGGAHTPDQKPVPEIPVDTLEYETRSGPFLDHAQRVKHLASLCGETKAVPRSLFTKVSVQQLDREDQDQTVLDHVKEHAPRLHQVMQHMRGDGVPQVREIKSLRENAEDDQRLIGSWLIRGEKLNFMNQRDSEIDAELELDSAGGFTLTMRRTSDGRTETSVFKGVRDENSLKVHTMHGERWYSTMGLTCDQKLIGNKLLMYVRASGLTADRLSYSSDLWEVMKK